MRIGKESSDPFTDLAGLMKETGYNKDVTLAFGKIIGMSPPKVRIDGNGLETTNLTVMPHLLPAYYPVHIIFESPSTLGEQRGKIMIDNDLVVGDRVAIIYDSEGSTVKGFILDKEE